MKYMRRTAGYIWNDYKTNAQIAKELKITQILDKLLEYKRNWIQHVNRMLRNRLPRVMKQYFPTGKRNHGRPLKRLLVTWDRNGSTSGPNPWQIYDDDDENPSSGSRVVPCGRTDMTKPIAAFRNFGNAPKNKLTNGVLYPLLNDVIYRCSKLFFTERHESPADCTTDEQYCNNISQHTGYCTENLITL